MTGRDWYSWHADYDHPGSGEEDAVMFAFTGHDVLRGPRRTA